MNTKSISILLVEENPTDRQFFKEILKNTSLPINKIYECNNQEEIEDLMDHILVDLIVLDLGLPNSDGLRGLEQIQSNYSHIPCIIYTDINDRDIALNAINIGAQDYIIKDEYNPVLIEKTIEYSIQRHKIHWELWKIKQQLDGYIYSVSHDLRGPVVNLKTLFKMLKTSGKMLKKNEVYDLVKHMRSSIYRLDATLEGLNAQLLHKKYISEPETVDLKSMVSEIKDSIDNIIQNASAVITTDFNGYPEIQFTKSLVHSVSI